jgi:hypothetical protein
MKCDRGMADREKVPRSNNPALSYLRAWRKLWPLLRSGDIQRALWMVLVLVLILLYNFDENTLLTYNGLPWVLYVSVVANIELVAAEDRLKATLRRSIRPLPMQPLTREREWQPTPS